MLPLIKRTGLSRAGAVLAAVLCLGAMTLSAKPADARIWVGFGFGYPGYYDAPYSYGYYPAYYGYYRPYYRWHHYRHVRYWRHHNWCRWHRCYW